MEQDKNLLEIKGKAEPDMDAFQFCMRALNLKKGETGTRIYVDHARIEKNTLICTDGMRLHKAQIEGEYEDGLYRVLKFTKSHVILYKSFEIDTGGNYPDVSTLFEYEVVKELSAEFDREYSSSIIGITKVIRALPTEKTINPAFLLDLGQLFTFAICKEPKVVFTDGNKTAVIMVASMGN